MSTASDAPLVLVIDNDPDTRIIVGDLLILEGYSVLVAESAETGLKLVRASSDPLVVLFNNIVPVPGGAELLAALLADDTLAARHAVVVMSASPRRAEAERHDVLTQPDAPTVAKPFDMGALLEAIAQAAQRLTASVEQKHPGRSRSR